MSGKAQVRTPSRTRPPFHKPVVTSADREWATWQQQRREDLTRQGMAFPLALRVSSGERKLRMQLVDYIGMRRAKDVRLLCRGTKDGELWFLMHPTVSLTPFERSTLRTALGDDFASAA
jgi:hypothetical protein